MANVAHRKYMHPKCAQLILHWPTIPCVGPVRRKEIQTFNSLPCLSVSRLIWLVTAVDVSAATFQLLLTEHADISLSPACEFPFTSNYTTGGRLPLLVWYELLLKVLFNTHIMWRVYTISHRAVTGHAGRTLHYRACWDNDNYSWLLFVIDKLYCVKFSGDHSTFVVFI